MIKIYWTAKSNFKYPGDLYVKFCIIQSISMPIQYGKGMKQTDDWLFLHMFPNYALCIKQEDYNYIYGALKLGIPTNDIYQECEVIREDPEINDKVFKKIFNLDLENVEGFKKIKIEF